MKNIDTARNFLCIVLCKYTLFYFFEKVIHNFSEKIIVFEINVAHTIKEVTVDTYYCPSK